MKWIGMWRVAASSFSLSSTRQPSMSGRLMSRVIALGLSSRARASAFTPRLVTRALNPFSWARS